MSIIKGIPLISAIYVQHVLYINIYIYIKKNIYKSILLLLDFWFFFMEDTMLSLRGGSLLFSPRKRDLSPEWKGTLHIESCSLGRID